MVEYGKVVWIIQNYIITIGAGCSSLYNPVFGKGL